jgi:hypothetical protein
LTISSYSKELALDLVAQGATRNYVFEGVRQVVVHAVYPDRLQPAPVPRIWYIERVKRRRVDSAVATASSGRIGALPRDELRTREADPTACLLHAEV